MGQYIASGAGSGVIVRADGYIITNSHVIAGAKDITVRLKNGESYAATLSGRDIRSDLAVLKIEATDLQPVTFGDSSSLTVGELAVVIGNPLGELGGTVTEGIISALDREIVVEGETMYLLQTSAAVNPGNSGGGLFNSRGQLVGLINAKSGGFNIEGLGFAIPVNTVQENMNQLIIHGYVTGRAALGVRLAEITDPEMAYYYQVDQPGVYILEAVEQNGLQNGDRIISIDGQVITETVQVRKILDQHEVGDRVILRIDRHNSELALPITLVELIS